MDILDLDDELEMLQRELMAVQQQKTNPLSQRTVAEIMIKLHHQGFKFFATTDGNQYITPIQLDQEISKFIQQRGRTKIGILPQILNLNNDLIESRINPICNASTHVRNGDNIFSADYLKSVILSIKQRLEIEGIIDIDDVALTQQFNMQFLMKLINENIEELDAEVIGTQLITKQYTRMKKRRMLGYLLAISRPISIETFMKSAKLSDSNPQKLIQQLIKQGKLKGKCQNSFYIPDRFSKNQKQVIQKFFENNGYLQFTMLQKNYLVAKPQQWIKKNIKGNYTFFEEVCFHRSKLDQYQTHLQSLLKGQGFVEISTVIPFDLDERKMEKFLNESCGLKNFLLNEGICYSEEWLNKCVNQFRDRVIFDIFFKKTEPKGGKKKGGKKQKQKDNKITENQLIQTLFDAGLAEYSVAEDLSQSLLPLLLERLDSLKVQCQKQLTQSQGVINSSFLKYRKCKSILKTQENLQRTLNIIEKQKKKSGPWLDPDFGPNQNDPMGKYALIYYDGVLPKDWPELNEIKWVDIPYKQSMTTQPIKSRYLSKSMVFEFMRVVDTFNQIQTKKGNHKIPTPLTAYHSQKNIQEEESYTAPFVFKFHTGQNEKRFVLIDQKIPLVNEQLFPSSGLYSLVEKAYAKLRYCYKGILSVSIQQVIFELTGLHSQKITIQNQKDEDLLLQQLYTKYLKQGKMVIGVGQGISQKKIKMEGVQTQFFYMRPYMFQAVEDQQESKSIMVYPENVQLQLKTIPRLFKNIYIISPNQQQKMNQE